MKTKINIQLSDGSTSWSEVKEFRTIEIDETCVGDVCRAIANVTGKSVRMTRPFGNLPVDRLNGGYFRPEEFVCPKAKNVNL